jgi:hypothetical protein
VEALASASDRAVESERKRFVGLGLLACAVAAAAAVLLTMAQHLTFILDDWVLLIGREGWSAQALLAPFNQHLMLGPLLVYRLLLAVFGMNSAFPFFVASTFAFLLSCVLLFVYLRDRVGDWLALLGATVVLFLGAAYEGLLWPIEIGYFVSVSAGLGMLIAFDRKDERGDRIACGCLAVSMAFSSVGVAFAAGAIVDLCLGGRVWQRRLYLVLPIGLYVIWWLGWGHTAETPFDLGNVVHAPLWVLDAAASGVTSILGLATAQQSERPALPNIIWGRAIVICALGLGALQLARGWRPSRKFAVVLAIALTFWILGALNANWARSPLVSRYQYESAIFVLLIAAELGRGVRPRASILVLATGVAALSVFSGQSVLSSAYSQYWRPMGELEKVELAGLELAGSRAVPGHQFKYAPADATVGDYLSMAAAHGSPAVSRVELLASPEAKRAAADAALVEALELHLRRVYPDGSAHNCLRLRRGTMIHPINVRDGQLTLANNGEAPAELRVGRIADQPSVFIGHISPHAWGSLRLPPVSLHRPWRLDLTPGGPVAMCLKRTV